MELAYRQTLKPVHLAVYHLLAGVGKTRWRRAGLQVADPAQDLYGMLSTGERGLTPSSGGWPVSWHGMARRRYGTCWRLRRQGGRASHLARARPGFFGFRPSQARATTLLGRLPAYSRTIHSWSSSSTGLRVRSWQVRSRDSRPPGPKSISGVCPSTEELAGLSLADTVSCWLTASWRCQRGTHA